MSTEAVLPNIFGIWSVKMKQRLLVVTGEHFNL